MTTDADLAAAAFPNSPGLFTTEQAASAPAPAQVEPTAPADAAPGSSLREEAVLRGAFPSMFPPPPPAPEAPAAAATPDAPAPTGEPSTVPLTSSGITVTLPAGVAPDSEALAAFDGVARDLGLDGPTAQRLADLHGEAIARAASEEVAAWTAVTAGWREAVKADPEIGGVNFDASVTLARGVLDRFAPELKAELRDLGLGNHPGLTKLLARIGRALPGAAPAARSAPAPHTAAAHQASEDTKSRAMFPSMYR
jgi:hypothetical protein